VWQDLGSIQICVILDLDILGDDSEGSDTAPFSNGRFPSNDATVDKRVFVNLGSSQEGGVGNLGSSTDFAVWSDDSVWSDHGIWVHLSSWVNDNVSLDVGSGGEDT